MVSIYEPAVQSYIAHSLVLALKLLLMAALTVKERITKKVFSTPEDVALLKGTKLAYDDPDVDRVRRAHLNDLENIPVFWVVGALYLTTGPAVFTAVWLFRAYTAGRLMHTVVYAIKPMPQPARAIFFELSNITCIYMAVTTLVYYFSWL